MHYKDGKEAKVNDLVISSQEWGRSGQEVVGILVSGDASASCDGLLLGVASRIKSDLGWGPWLPASDKTFCVDLSSCLKVEVAAPETPAAAPAAPAPASRHTASRTGNAGCGAGKSLTASRSA